MRNILLIIALVFFVVGFFSITGGQPGGVIFSIIGFPIFLVGFFMKRNSKLDEQQLFKQGKLVQCPYCKEFVQPDASICKHCHKDLTPSTIIHYSTIAGQASSSSPLTTPLSQRGIPVWIIYTAGIIGSIYFLNSTGGVMEVIPDNLPFLGHLDECVAFIPIIYSLIELFSKKRYKRIA